MRSQIKHNQTNHEPQKAGYRAIDWEPRVPFRGVSVVVQDGVVTLAGSEHLLREECAAVGAVNSGNDIMVRSTSTPGDSGIAGDILEALRIYIFEPGDCVKVTVSDGYVKLEGSVKWDYQRRNAESAVRPIMGVRGIINAIKVTARSRPTGGFSCSLPTRIAPSEAVNSRWDAPRANT